MKKPGYSGTAGVGGSRAPFLTEQAERIRKSSFVAEVTTIHGTGREAPVDKQVYFDPADFERACSAVRQALDSGKGRMHLTAHIVLLP